MGLYYLKEKHYFPNPTGQIRQKKSILDNKQLGTQLLLSKIIIYIKLGFKFTKLLRHIKL